MPEGNEIHLYASHQAELFAGRPVTVDAPNGRFAEDAKLLSGRRLRSVEAFGKHLLYDFGRGRQLHVHLGLYGKFHDGEMPYPEAKGALRMRFSTRLNWLELRGPTVCEVIDESGRKKLIERIGPDPLRADADLSVATRKVIASRAPIGALLMDQSVVSGIGNIFRAELLFRARLNPLLDGRSINSRTLGKLWKDARLLMRAGMVDRRIVTTRSVDRPHPKDKARRGETHYVYRRAGQPCFVCGTKILVKEFVGRRLYWCPTCQAGP